MTKDSEVEAAERRLVAEAEARLRRAHDALDDILEDWQLHGMHGHQNYQHLKRAVEAVGEAYLWIKPVTR